ncbi:phage tail tape measure protein [Cohnella sp. GCM10012308]|uniref:phage tail tape measure protein n=1 Tax=Cohnella sp. GCM10012308 TaxID=3317329 RepID=UPI003612FA98
MPGRSREYDIAFRLNGLMDSSFRQSMGDAERHIEELERALRAMNSRGDLDDLRRDADRTEGSIDRLTDGAKHFGDTLKRVAEVSGAFAIVNRASDSLQDIVGTVFDQSDAMAQLEAATGATAEEMAVMHDSVEDLYNMRLGDGFEDLSNAMATVRQVSKATGDELEGMTKDAIVYRDVFGEDITESIKASDTMMKNFGVSSKAAYNLLAQGAQKGLNKSGELLDSANEYSVYFSTLGYSAEDMFNQFAAGLDAGAFNLDKVGDAVKEFGIRIKDGSDSTSDALAALFAPDNIVKWTDSLKKGGTKSKQYIELAGKVGKTTANQMLANLNKGGKKASDTFTVLQSVMGKGQYVLDGLSDGSLKGRDAMQMVIDKLDDIKDPIERSTIGVALFGTQFEDMEAGVISALGSARQQFDMTKQTMDDVAAVKYDTLSKQFQAVGRELMTGLVIPLSEDLMPLLQDFAGWLGDNKELVKVIALGVPAVLLAKNTVKIVRSLMTVQAAAAGAGGAAGAFGTAAALLTNPIGLAVAGVGALTLGVIAYKRHQEKARQELLNMGDSLGEAYSNFDEIDHANKRTQNLITEYDRLTAKIKNSKTPADELTEARRKLSNVEQELIDMNPQILSAEDARSDRFREQLDLVKGINQAKADMSKRELEHQALEAEGKLPELEDLYPDLEAKLEKQNTAYEKAKESYRDYLQYMNELQGIRDSDESYDEKTKDLNSLAQKIQSETGLYYGGNWANLEYDLNNLEKSFDGLNNKIGKTEKEIADAQDSFASYYNLQVKMIENELGGSIEKMAERYNKASEAEKKRFAEAAQAIDELNKQVDLLPAEKKINVDVLYKTSGLPQPAGTGSKSVFADAPWMPKVPELPKYAKGGIANSPSIFGEAGPEIAIPLDNRPRSHALLDVANDMMGRSGEGSSGDITVTWAPVITVQGGDPETEQRFRQALQDSQADFERKFRQMVERRERVSLR